MSAREVRGEWVVQCDADCGCDYCVAAPPALTCMAYVLAPTLILATSTATRSGWVTRPVTVDIDGVPRQRVEHYCPTHKGVTG